MSSCTRSVKAAPSPQTSWCCLSSSQGWIGTYRNVEWGRLMVVDNKTFLFLQNRYSIATNYPSYRLVMMVLVLLIPCRCQVILAPFFQIYQVVNIKNHVTRRYVELGLPKCASYWKGKQLPLDHFRNGKCFLFLFQSVLTPVNIALTP